MSHSNEDLQKMQQDAIRRVKEMQARAKKTIQNSCNHTINQDINKLPIKSKHKNKCFKCAKQKNSFPIKIVQSLLKDEERSLIVILLLLLSGEKENFNIIITLIYLLM